MVLNKIWLLYRPYAYNHPIPTKIISAFWLFFSADFISQKAIENKPTWDIKRTMRIGLVAGIFVNPIN